MSADRALIGSLVVVMIVVACHRSSGQPLRPPGVPEQAVWAGGADGGAWIECHPSSSFLRCVMYDDQDGDVWAKGDYNLVGHPSGSRLSFESFDGESVWLVGGGRLAPVEGRVEYPPSRQGALHGSPRTGTGK